MTILSKRTAAGGQVLILAPTEKLVTAVLSRFASGAARLDARAKAGAWPAFVAGTLPVAVATRTAALFHAPGLVGIVVVAEDHPGHNEASAPYTNARDLAVARARVQGLALTLISASPTPAALGAGVSLLAVGGPTFWPQMRLAHRVDDEASSTDPLLDLLDAHASAAGALPPRRKRNLVPVALVRAIVAASKAGQTPVVLVQSTPARRRCSGCGVVRPCSWCQESTCVHPETSACQACGSSAVRMSGWDAPRVTALLRDQVRAVTLTELANEKDAGLVIVFDTQSLASAPSLLPGALLCAAVLSAARAAGHGGSVLLCTEGSADALLHSLVVDKDLVAVAKQAWASAESHVLPPFGRLVTVTCAKKPNVSSWPGTVHGPRWTGKDWDVLIRCTDAELEQLRPALLRLRRGGKARIRIQ
jgi:primosomal protein N'